MSTGMRGSLVAAARLTTGRVWRVA
jgi:hypothetical protein